MPPVCVYLVIFIIFKITIRKLHANFNILKKITEQINICLYN